MKGLIKIFSDFVSEYLFYIKLVAIALLVVGAYFKGVNDERSVWLLKEEKTKVATIEKKEKRTEVTAKSAAKSSINRKKVEQQSRLEDINVYLSKKDVASCTIPDGFVRLHNESAEGRVSNAPSEPNGSTEERVTEATGKSDSE